MSKYELINNKEERRYEFHVDGLKPHIDYVERGEGVLYLTHTIVPPQLEGKGIGSMLVKKVLEDIDSQGKRIIPKCWFIVKYIKIHPEWEYLLYDI